MVQVQNTTCHKLHKIQSLLNVNKNRRRLSCNTVITLLCITPATSWYKSKQDSVCCVTEFGSIQEAWPIMVDISVDNLIGLE